MSSIVSSWRGKQVFLTPTQVITKPCYKGVRAVSRGVLLRPGWDRILQVFGAPSSHPCIFSKSSHQNTLISSMGTHSRAKFDQVSWWDLAMVRQCAKSTVGRKAHSVHLCSYKRGNPAVPVWSWNKYNAQLTKSYPDASARFAMYFDFSSWRRWCKQCDHLFPQNK